MMKSPHFSAAPHMGCGRPEMWLGRPSGAFTPENPEGARRPRPRRRYQTGIGDWPPQLSHRAGWMSPCWKRTFTQAAAPHLLSQGYRLTPALLAEFTAAMDLLQRRRLPPGTPTLDTAMPSTCRKAPHPPVGRGRALGAQAEPSDLPSLSFTGKSARRGRPDGISTADSALAAWFAPGCPVYWTDLWLPGISTPFPGLLADAFPGRSPFEGAWKLPLCGAAV
jgi:hypothetical protein